MRALTRYPAFADAIFVHKALLALSDVLAVSLGFVFSYTLRNHFFGWRGGVYEATPRHAFFLVGLLLFLVFIFRHRGLYRDRALHNGVEQLEWLSASWLAFYAYFLGAIFFLRIHLFWEHRITMFIFLALGWLLLVAGRMVMVPAILNWSRYYEKCPRRILCLARGEEAARVRDTVCREQRYRPVVAGFLDHRIDPAEHGAPEPLGTVADVTTVLDQASINEVYLNLQPVDWAQNTELMRALEARNVRVRIGVDQFGETGNRLPDWPDFESGYLFINQSHFFRLEQLVKGLMDRVGALALFVLLTPALLLISLAIRLESPGPILFKQRRVGLGGKTFEVLKFRTMKENTEQYHREAVRKFIEKDHAFLESEGQRPGFYKLAPDQHVTRMGAFLRKSSLDELPQLVNVLRGDMSLVGPRPLPTYEVELFKPWQHYRHEIKPGITGFWQVYGRSSVSHEDAILMDIFYRLNWSLSLDLRIFVRTLFVLMTGKGAL